MKNKKSSSKKTEISPWLIAAATLVLIAIGAGIFLLKCAGDKSSGRQFGATKAEQAVVDSLRNIAIPQTSVEPSTLPVQADTVPPAMPDSIGRDARSAQTAGQEDGYAAGLLDGQTKEHGHSYDTLNAFDNAADKAAYTAAYKQAYEEGFAAANLPEKAEEETDAEAAEETAEE